MLPLALWASPSPQLQQAFPGTALATDTPENPVLVHRQGTLCLAPTRLSWNGPFMLSGLETPGACLPFP